MKLWDKEYNLNKEVEEFTVGNDYLLDKKLIKHDCIASIAHAKMLNKIKIITDDELKKLEQGLNKIIELDNQGKFEILPENEDCHTAIEIFLTQKYGDVGKKIHTCRSRNDQVLVALRIYEKEKLVNIKGLISAFQGSLKESAEKNKGIVIPGYTHMQKAMPVDASVWLGSFLESSKDNLFLADSLFSMIDKCPLGTAAGFGVPIMKTDNKLTADLLGFSSVFENPMHAQMSRGKYEFLLMHLLSQIMLDLNKLAVDLMLFSTKEFGYIDLPKELCTGSSIMPHKKNPDVLELVRAKYHVVLAEEFKISSIISSTMSGYNRDVQLTKEPLFSSFETVESSLSIMKRMIDGIIFDKDKCKESLSKELYATQEVYEMVKEGMPFRQAYEIVKKKLFD